MLDLYFAEIYRRLLEISRERVRSGSISERRLARAAEISQPHLHHALKNVRMLSTPATDRLMVALGLAVPQLLWDHKGEPGGFVIVAVIGNRTGAGPVLGPPVSYYPLPAGLVEGLVDPVLTRVSPDPVLPRAFLANDLILLDQNPEKRECPETSGCWVVIESGELRVRYVRRLGERFFIADEATLTQRAQWLPVVEGTRISDVVRARIIWIGRQLG